MGKRTNLGWVVYGQDIDQPKLIILTNLFLSVPAPTAPILPTSVTTNAVAEWIKPSDSTLGGQGFKSWAEVNVRQEL